MSHQDAHDDTTNADDLQAALDWLVPEEVLADVTFRQEGVWSPRTLVFAALMWSWSAKFTLTKRFAEARKVVAWGSAEGQQPGKKQPGKKQPGKKQPGKKQPGKSYTGFIKRLGHWSGSLLGRVVVEFRRCMREQLSSSFLVGGWLVLAGDGSRTATPRTRSNEQRFAAKKKRKRQCKRQRKRQCKRQRKAKAKAKRTRQQNPQIKQSQADRAKKAGTPQIWLTMLYHVGLGLPWDWRSGASDSSERDHLLEMADALGALPERALVTLDAGFVGYDFWQRLDQMGVAFVARVGSNVRLLRNLGHVRRQRDIVCLWPDQAQRDRTPPLVLRLHGFCGAKEEVYLVTNVLDPGRLSASQMREVYQARWGVEVYYRDFKQTFGRAKLLSKTADNAQLELDWSIVGLWAMCLFASARHMADRLSPRRRSLAGVLHAFRLPMEQPRCAADEAEDLLSLIAGAIQDGYTRRRSKASRNHPRKKKKHAIGQPTILNATPEQQTAAKNLKAAA